MRLSVTTLVLLLSCASLSAEPITVGSKNFTESYILGEIVTQLLNARGIEAVHQRGLGGTKICFDALVAGEIDLYPEYTGTIKAAILKQADDAEVEQRLASQGLEIRSPLGFNNTYVLAVRREIAKARNLKTISDLATHDDLVIALSHEFRAREDGWPALGRHYGFSLTSRGIEHGLAYQALANGEIDLTDAYSTDGELLTYGLALLDDDRRFFPRYDALWLARTALPTEVQSVLDELAGTIDAETMQRLNRAATSDGIDTGTVAATFLSDLGLVSAGATAPVERWWQSLLRNTARHLLLTSVAVSSAALFGIALAFLVLPHARLSAFALSICALAQTIPSIALLALMIPVLGIGIWPAMVALFLYALLPIVRAALTAMRSIDPVHLNVADALGMNPAEVRRYVLTPMAMPHMLAGLRTAAVISIGTATLAAFIGAGGLGEPIVTGLALNDTRLILKGAIPAAILAILTDLAFDQLERRLVPAHLRPR